MIEIVLPYPDDDPVAAALGTTEERVKAEPAGEGLARLTASQSLFQLAQGDVVRIDADNRVVGIEELADVWLFVVYTLTPDALLKPGIDDPDAWNLDALDDVNWEAAALTADRIETDLSRRAPVERTTRYTFEVTTESRVWFDQWLADTTGLAFYQVLREPGQQLTWEQAQADTTSMDQPVFRLNPNPRKKD